MPITVEFPDMPNAYKACEAVFSYFHYIDEKFSTYKDTSEISRINNGSLSDSSAYSDDMKTVLQLCDDAKKRTGGYFDIVTQNGSCDPSGLVKGWSILNSSKILEEYGISDFYINAGGDIHVGGSRRWRIGIKNPFHPAEIVKVVSLSQGGIATSGTYVRGNHIYNPHNLCTAVSEIVSLTVIGPTIYDADVYATAAFAMGRNGLGFIDGLPMFEGYMIDAAGRAFMTRGFNGYVQAHA